MPRKKNSQFAFRTSEKDAAAIRNKIADSGQNQQNYLTHAALNAPIIYPEGFRELLTEYKHQGSNLNQIARILNRTGNPDPSTTRLINEMYEERTSIWQLLNLCTQVLASARR